MFKLRTVRILFSLFLFISFCISFSFAQSKLEVQKVNAKNSFGLKPNWIPIPARETEAELINEGFEENLMPPTGWTHTITNSSWTWYIDDLAPYEGTYNATLEYDPDLVPQDEWLISPSFSLESAAAGTFTFAFATSYYWHVDPNDNADMFVKISTDGGSSWTDLWTEDDYGVFVNWEWNEVTLDLTGYAGQADLKVAFEYVGVDGAQYSLDNIVVTDQAVCIVEDASAPSPADNASNIEVTGAQLSWTNGAQTVGTELWFGTDPENLSLVAGSSSTLLTDYSLPELDYLTAYYWSVTSFEDEFCSEAGPTWKLVTAASPDALFFDDFESGSGNWTITNEGGTCIWEVFSSPYPNTYTLPGTSAGSVLAADADNCGSGTTINTIATIDQTFDFSLYTDVAIEFDNDWYHIDAEDEAHLEVSTDGGSSWDGLWDYAGASVRNSHEVIDATASLAGQASVMIRLRSVQPGYDWWWVVDNFTVSGEYVVPVELTSFNASVIGQHVSLNWQTATETNNYGFEVERKSDDQQYSKVGFIAGHGTTTEMKSYSFVDNSVASGSFSYRLKQIDLDGSVNYSNEVEVLVKPSSFSLAQNYPNPFNPSTKIDFALASDSKVTLKIFNVLGQEVATLLNGNLSAGNYSQSFDASGFNSGVYFYTIEATGVDGKNFSATKKMILTK